MRTTTRTARTRVTSALLAAGVGAALAVGTGVAIAQTDDDAPTTDVLDTLGYTLEEERMARDLYDALGEAHDGLVPFTHIEVSEQRHHDAVADLLTRRGGTLPEEGAPGEFAHEDIQAMYDDWLERGLVSPEAAYEVGIELETADIEGLRTDIDEIDDADVDRVLGHLLRSSEHHLAAFEAAAAGELPDGPGPGVGPRGGPGRGTGPGQGMGPGHGVGPGQGMQQGTEGQRGPGLHQGQGGHRHGDGTGGCPMRTTDDA